MSPLMQTIFEELSSNLDRYLDSFQKETYDEELKHLYEALSAVLPEHGLELFDRYSLLARSRALLETEAMFRAAFAAARELS